MTIEATLESIDNSLKALVTLVQSGAQMSAAIAGTNLTAVAEATKKAAPRGKKADSEGQQALPVVEGDPVGTRYWVSESLKQVYSELPGTPVPEDETFKIETGAHYLVKKAEFEAAKNAQATSAVATQQATATTAPSATAPAATASAATSGGDVSWDDVVTALKSLATNPAHGSAAVKTIITQIDPKAANVPALKELGKNAEIVAAVNALLNPATGDAALFG